jgi:ATP sulfurylase
LGEGKLKKIISVVEKLRLVDGTLFSIPINLDVSDTDIERLGVKRGVRLALRDPRDEAPLAIITGGSNMFSLSRLGTNVSS